MSHTTRAILLGVFMLAASIWVGGYVAIAVVARAATRTLAPTQRVALFRGVGRTYGLVAGAALMVALGTGAGLVSERAWDGTLTEATVLAAALVVALAVGVVQARRMTRLRLSALAAPEDLRLARCVRHGARSATMLRAAIGLLSLAVIALATMLAP